MIINAKTELLERVKRLDDEMAQKLLDEWDDILLQLELESDEETFEAYNEARQGKNLIPHDEVKRLLEK